MRIIFTIALCAWLLTGCSRSAGPSVSLVTFRFENATALETTAVFTLRLSNESPQPQKFTGGVHKIYLNGLYIGRGLSGDRIEVPRLGTLTQEVTVHLSNLALATRIKSILEAKSFDYRVRSTFYGDSWFSRTQTETEGKLDLKDFTPTTADTNAPATNAAPVPAQP